MAKVKKRKKKKVDVNAPDEFQETMARVAPFVERHGAKLLIGAVVLLLVVIGVYVGVRMAKSRSQASKAAFQAKLTTVVTAAQEGDKKRVESSLEELPSSGGSIAVMLARAAALRKLGKWKDAAETYAMLMARLTPGDPLRPIVAVAQAEAQLAAKDFHGAQASAKALEEEKDSVYKGIASTLLGDVKRSGSSKAKGSKQDAVKFYTKALKEFHKVAQSGLAALYGNLVALRLIGLK